MNTATAFISVSVCVCVCVCLRVCERYKCVLLGNNNPLSPICLPAFCLLKDSMAIFYLTATTLTRSVQTAPHFLHVWWCVCIKHAE